jgi:hypothetical protein
MISIMDTKKQINKKRKDTSLSRIDKYVSFFRKNPDKKYTVKEIYDKFPFNTSMNQVRITLEKGILNGKVKSTITEAGVTYHL